MFFTEAANHFPPRAVCTPRAFSASVISRSVVAPAFCAARMIGSTLDAWRSAFDLMTAWPSWPRRRLTLCAFEPRCTIGAPAIGSADSKPHAGARRHLRRGWSWQSRCVPAVRIPFAPPIQNRIANAASSRFCAGNGGERSEQIALGSHDADLAVGDLDPLGQGTQMY
jgi:hypothetical protein